MTASSVVRQNIPVEIAAFDRLSAEGKHAGLSAREYAQFFGQIGLADLAPQSRIIDLGCGDGLMACKIAQMGFTNVTGVDLSPGNVAAARRRAQTRRVAPDFRVGDIAELSGVESDSYDVALVSGVIHHFPTFETKRSVVAEARRTLRSGGMFAGLEPNRWNPYWYIPLLMMKLTWSGFPISFRYVKCHCTENEKNLLSIRELRRIFRDLGIKGVRFEAFPHIPPTDEERSYREGAAALYRDVMERFFSRLLPKPHNSSYFVFKARLDA